MVLVVVMWLIAALVLMVAGLSGAARSDVSAAAALKDLTVFQALADGAILVVAADLASSGREPPATSVRQVVLGNSPVEVAVAHAAGWVDINRAQPGLIEKLLIHVGHVSPDEAAVLAARIIDWRDEDTTRLPGGAEDEDYIAAGSPYRTRGNDYRVPEDLLQVLGMRYDVFDRIRPFVTVEGSDSGLVNPLAAPFEVLLALAGGNSVAAESIANSREPGMDLSALAQAYIDTGALGALRLEARLTAPDGRIFIRTKWARLERDAKPASRIQFLRAGQATFMARNQQ